MIEIVETNAVVAVSDLKVSKFSQSWLTKSRVAREEDLVEGSFFTPMAVAQRTSAFELVLLPVRVQVRAISASEQASHDAALRAIDAFLEACQDDWITITAVGFNVHYVVHEDCAGYWAGAKSLFSESAKFVKYFETVGAMASATIEGGVTATFEMKPIRSDDGAKEAYNIAFNFNLDIGDRAGARAMFAKFAAYESFANDVVKSLELSLKTAKEGVHT